MSQWWYVTGVSRIQTRLRLPLPVYFLMSEDPAKMYELSNSRCLANQASYELTSHDVSGAGIDDMAWRMN